MLILFDDNIMPIFYCIVTSCHILYPSQIISRFDFFKFINFTIHLDIIYIYIYVYIHRKIYESRNTKMTVIWNGGSKNETGEEQKYRSSLTHPSLLYQHAHTL